MHFNHNSFGAFLWLFVQGPQVSLSLGKYRYCALHESQGNFPGVILGRVPKITHISSLHSLYNCTGCNNVNITVLLLKSERTELVSISQISVFLFFLIYFAVCALLYYAKDKTKGDIDRIKDQGGKNRRKCVLHVLFMKIKKYPRNKENTANRAKVFAMEWTFFLLSIKCFLSTTNPLKLGRFLCK